MKFRLFVAAISLSGCANLTPAQSAADQAAANAIINGLAPLACDIVSIADPAKSQGVCQVITNVETGATALVPIVATAATLTAIVAAKPSTSALKSAIKGK